MRSFISVAILGAVASADCRADYNKEDPCMADAKCTWCFSGAVPSACYDLADAAGLPAGVFNCEAKSVAITAPEADFMQHISEQGLSYGTVAEYNFRKNLFNEAHAEIVAHNNSNATWTLEHNFMSTMTQAEKKRMMGYKATQKTSAPEEIVKANADSVNWVTAGAVTPVKNQGSCGSCWSFSSTGALEGAHEIKTKTLLSFSEQQLVDCSKKNNGCNGGSMALAFQYYESNFAELESVYPYTGRDGTCQYDSKSKTSVKVSSYSNITADSSDALKASIAKGPTSVAIQADKRAFQNYKSGVLTGSACGTNLDHGVLAVGYGTEGSTPYYLVKNSWGPSWGDAGYIKIGIESGKGVCGIQMDPVRPSSN